MTTIPIASTSQEFQKEQITAQNELGKAIATNDNFSREDRKTL